MRDTDKQRGEDYDRRRAPIDEWCRKAYDAETARHDAEVAALGPSRKGIRAVTKAHNARCETIRLAFLEKTGVVNRAWSKKWDVNF